LIILAFLKNNFSIDYFSLLEKQFFDCLALFSQELFVMSAKQSVLISLLKLLLTREYGHFDD